MNYSLGLVLKPAPLRRLSAAWYLYRGRAGRITLGSALQAARTFSQPTCAASETESRSTFPGLYREYKSGFRPSTGA